jgi:hypothetical protein
VKANLNRTLGPTVTSAPAAPAAIEFMAPTRLWDERQADPLA